MVFKLYYKATVSYKCVSGHIRPHQGMWAGWLSLFIIPLFYLKTFPVQFEHLIPEHILATKDKMLPLMLVIEHAHAVPNNDDNGQS